MAKMIPKFRAWDTKWKRWILPGNISYYGGEWYFERRGEDGGDIIETAVGFKEIILEWFTGKRDKNKKEIYGGDRAMIAYRVIGETIPGKDESVECYLQWNETDLQYEWLSDEPIHWCPLNLCDSCDIEAIGTIHNEEQK